MIEVTGKKGTIVALDTRGLHKGKRLNKGDRFIMQFEFTGNLFGAPIFYSTVESHSPALNSAKEKYPAFYEIMKIK